jgi:acetyl-CoA carboxylase biotin carboxyl carrier protein
MAKFEMDTEFIRRLAKLLDETNLGEIEMADGDRRIRVARPAVAAAPVAMTAAPAPVAGPDPASAGPAAAAADASRHPGAVKSPMVGTAYLSPEPGKPVFVSVGDKVAAGQTVCIIEAMKTFNPIKAPKAGTVAQVLIENAQPVEFGQPLMIVE